MMSAAHTDGKDMNIGIQTWGSYGDVRPFLALGHGLSRAGHNVTLAVCSIDGKKYGTLAERYGLRIVDVPPPFEIDKRLFDEVTARVIEEKNPFSEFSIISRHFLVPWLPAAFAAAQKLCRNQDLVIGPHFLHLLRVAAEQTNIPHITVSFTHFSTPSRYAAPIGAPRLGTWANRMSWFCARKFVNKMVKPSVNSMRRENGLACLDDVLTDAWASRYLNLIAVSPAFCPPRNDWGSHHCVCGFLDLPEEVPTQPLPDAVRTFLAAGEAPVYMTFGSLMPLFSEQRRRTIRLLRDATIACRCRAIIQVHREDLDELTSDDTIFFTDSIPHKAIFPHCRLVVHHGGSGTTHSATRAQCPSVIVAHIFDQPLWGEQLRLLGLAPKPLRRARLTPERLARAIRAVLETPEMQAQARTVGARMQNDDGVSMAVAAIQNRFRQGAGRQHPS